LVAVLLMAGVASAIVGSYLAYSGQSVAATRRMLDYQKAQIAAESGIQYAVVQLLDVLRDNQLTLSQGGIQAILDQVPPPPPIGDYEFVTPQGQEAFEITADTTVINGVITNGAACIGSKGEYEVFTITAGARNPNTGVGAVLQQQLQGVGLFLVRYAVFYEDDLEILPGPAMTISGPVHANGNMYLNSGGSLRIFDRTTAVGDIYHRRKDKSASIKYVGIYDNNNIEQPLNIDSDSPNWMIDALTTWGGRVLSKAHGVQHLKPPIAEVDEAYAIIEQPLDPFDPAYQQQTEDEKFANKACLTIHVLSNGTFTAFDCHMSNVVHFFTNAVLRTNSLYSGKWTYKKASSDYAYRFESNGAYDVSAVFYDKREGVDMAPIDIYVNVLTQCFPQVCSSSNYTIPEGRGVVYITRDDPDGVSNGVMPCVRIRNGYSLPHAGITFASDLPIYLEGNYNVTNTQPALVAGDAVTFLSRNWQDAKSWGSVNHRTAKDTKYNVVIMTGNTETSWGHYNGGLENVLRFLEKWSNKYCTFRGSIIDLWYSRKAIKPWSYGSYYKAPKRDWGYDPMYFSKVPPGMTRVFGLEEIEWDESSWVQVGWN